MSLAPSSAGAFNDSRTGGGFGVSALVPAFSKKVDIGIKGTAGDGIGRYGSAQLADLTFRPDGTQALIRTMHGLARIEFHPTPKWDIYAYYGGEYAWRAGYQGYDSITITKTPAIPATATTPAVAATTTTVFKLNQIGGYGNIAANNTGCSTENPPSNQLTPSAGGTCAGDIRIIQEGTIGFWHKMYQGPKGGLRWGSPVLLPYEDRLVWRRRSCGWRRGYFPQGRGQHGLDLFPLLPAVVEVRRLAACPSPGDGKRAAPSRSCPFFCSSVSHSPKSRITRKLTPLAGGEPKVRSGRFNNPTNCNTAVTRERDILCTRKTQICDENTHETNNRNARG